jgi:hypothetical protein
MKNMKKSLVLFAFSSLLLAGCQTQTGNTNHAGHANHNQNASQTATEKTAEDFTVDFKTAPAEAKAGEQVDLILTVKNARGETVKDLQISHEKPLHLIVVSEDLAEFYHLHPELQPDGSYKAPFAFENGGKYKLYADFLPKDAKQVVKISDLTVAGNPRAKEDLKADEKFEKTVGDLRVVMKPDAELEAGKDVTLGYSVFDARSGQPATDLQKYLGETAHFVIINQELNEFVHAHPASRDNVKGEHSHGAGEQKHDEKLAGQNAEANVAAHVNFPKPGIYKIWAEFQRNGKVTAVPFVVSVKQGKEPAPVSEVKVPEGAFKITVSRDGFTPQQITYKKGQPLKLAFVRTDEQNCGTEVVFKSLNITKKLPVGEVVTVDIPTDKEGAITFACGMNMYQGQIIVQ